MHPFSLLFLLALATALAVQLGLAQRQISAVAAQRHDVPPAFAAHVDGDHHRRATDYAIDRAHLYQVEAVVDALLLLIWTLGGGIAAVDAAWRSLELGAIATGTGVVASVLALSAVVGLPLRAWRVFVIEQRYGFNRMTPGLFAADCLRVGALALVLGGALLSLVIALMHSAGALWWLWVWGVWLLFNMVLLWAWPRCIAPLFNRLEPLRDTTLRARLEDLAERCGFRSEGVQIADGSRRSAHGNAYFTGVGRSRRIVLFDTLLAQLTPEQIEAVLAHELGHFRLNHIPRRLALSAALSLAALGILAWLMQQAWFYHALGVPVASVHTALLLFLLCAPLVGLYLRPLFAALSRRDEFEADAFAARHCPPEHLISALIALYRENAATLTPDPLYSAFHDSHPPPALRVARLERAANP